MTDPTRNPILVGVDGSPNAGIAAAWAVEIGRRTETPVAAIAAWSQRPSSSEAAIHDFVSEMDTQMAEVAARSLHDAGIDGVEVTAARGPVAEVLLTTANESNASMLVVGTRGLGPLSGLLLGSISRRLLFAARLPLVVVPRRSTLNPPALTRILVGVDCSPVAQRILSWSAGFCSAVGVPATIVRCTDPGCERPPGHVERVEDHVRSDTEQALEPFRDLGVEYTIAVARCDPRVALPQTARTDQAGLIVIGTRGEGQFSGLGGTASYPARHSPSPLAVIP